MSQLKTSKMTRQLLPGTTGVYSTLYVFDPDSFTRNITSFELGPMTYTQT